MAASDSLRDAFAKDCAKIIMAYGIDGIDFDWEYPTISWAGISSSPDDTENFTKLILAIRKEIGQDKILTLASSSSSKYINFEEIIPVVDFINLMKYDMSDGEKHHAPLYYSAICPDITITRSVKAHMDNGVPKDKIVVGIPFYGRGINPQTEKTYYCDFKDIEIPQGYKESWDELAQVPYIADYVGNFVFGFDNPHSISIKCEYIIENDLKGAIYWDYNGDDSLKTLSKTNYKILIK